MVLQRIRKSKYGITGVVAAVVTAVAIVAAILFGSMLPSKTSFREVVPVGGGSAEETKITSMALGNGGEEYFIIGKAAFEKRSANDDELLAKRDYKAEIKRLVAEKGVQTKTGSLENFICKYVETSAEEGYLLAFDGRGNIFKYKDSADGITLTDDFYISSSNDEYMELCYDGNEAYAVFKTEEAVMELRKFDVRNLSDGALATRTLWSIDGFDGSDYVLTTDASQVKLWSIAASEEFVYIALNRGVYKIAKDFSDDGNGLLFFEEARAEMNIIYRQRLYDEARNAECEVSENASVSELESALEQAGLKGKFAQWRNAARREVKNSLSWCKAYDGKTLTVKKAYCNFEGYSVSKYGMKTPIGAAYAASNDTIYLVDDYHLYALSPQDLDTLDYGEDTLDDLLEEVALQFDDALGSNSPVVYNASSACLYLGYANTNKITIVDVRDTEKLLYTFSAGYGIQKQFGNANNGTYHYLLTPPSDTSLLYVYSVSPEKAANSSLFTALMWLSVAVAVLGAITAFVAFYGYRSARGKEKLAFIGKDLRKHRGVYLAVLPFIVLICLFCYYEAIGSLSYSFFEYTQERPTLNWNNFANFRTVIVDDPDFWRTVYNMLFFLVFDIVLAIVPPLLFAFMLSIMRGKGYSKLMRTMLFIPGILPGVATMLIWKIGIFGDTGVLNRLLMNVFGRENPISFLSDKNISTWSLLLMGFPFVGSYLIFYGGMMNIPSSYYEAAELEGITVLRRLVSIDIPLVMSQVKYVFITTFISSVQNYSRTFMLDSASKTPVHNLYLQMQRGNYSVSSAYAALIFVFLLAAMIVNFRSQKKELEGTL